MHGAVQLFQFFVYVRSGGGVADVRVDFAEEGHADTHRLEIAVIDVGGDDSATARYFVTHQFGREFFAFGDVLHFLSDDALARVVHLRDIVIALGCTRGSHIAVAAVLHGRSALLNPCIPHRHKAPVYTPNSGEIAVRRFIIALRLMGSNLLARCGAKLRRIADAEVLGASLLRDVEIARRRQAALLQDDLALQTGSCHLECGSLPIAPGLLPLSVWRSLLRLVGRQDGGRQKDGHGMPPIKTDARFSLRRWRSRLLSAEL